MSNVLLLREPSEGSDKYEKSFQFAGYHPISVPVLETLVMNVSALGEIIRGGPETRRLNGVVITSKRSCDAWKGALDCLHEEMKLSFPESIRTAIGEWVAKWSGIPFYVVGEKSASSLQDTFSGLGSVDVRGLDSGNAANLANYILADLRDEPHSRLLYLTGDKNRDTMTQILANSNIKLEPLQVYQTQLSPTFHRRLSLAIESSSHQGSEHWWIVHFAPSAAAFTAPVLKEYFLVPQQNDLPSGPTMLLPARVAAIGPTTNSFLTDDLRQRVDVVAQKPSPEELVAAIVCFDQKNKC